MRFNCGAGWRERRAKKEEWHPWFAWRPVQVDDYDCRWLETVQRKGKFVDYGSDSYWHWEYRAPQTGG